MTGFCLISAFAIVRPSSGDSIVAEGNSVKGIMLGMICLGIGILWLLVCCCGICAIGLRFWPCLFVLIPITFSCSVILLASGALEDTIGDQIEKTCKTYEVEI